MSLRRVLVDPIQHVGLRPRGPYVAQIIASGSLGDTDAALFCLLPPHFDQKISSLPGY